MAPDTPIFVLTDTPALYGTDLLLDGRPPVFVRDAATLLARLKDADFAGLVLEIGKVMRAGRAERDRLFSYAGCFPVLRTKPHPRVGFVAYLDPRDRFLASLAETAGKRVRAHDRVAALLPCLFSREDDPSLVHPLEGLILDISPGGCFIKAARTFPGETFAHVRIPRLANRRPIFSSVRWSSAGGTRPGVGIMFIDIAEDQAEEIAQLRDAKDSGD
ncbi:PilZ domain-containing protein [Pseudodesulfovibrio pelocollis]|uniref:PilZ domain-containing protein n=1 Tax=Pseudodesulfovibrio pelocollis TaxID=3051432 RepID=UPI00255ACB11|nr:PilZ domain-containing protein [Pseudodesulfovibrio sp. SB368]